MEFVSRKVDGPAVTSKTRREALTELYNHPAFPKNARVEDIEEVDGKWIATLGIPKQADFPFSDDGGEESKPKEKSKNDFEGPNGDTDSEPKDESDDLEESEDSEDKGDKDKKGEKGEISQLKEVVDAIANALGIPIPGAEGDSPIPGEDGLDSPDGPPGLPPGLDAGPPPGGPAPHEHPLKPGEAPPGATPVGAPAFSSVQEPVNPFPEHIGKQRAFEVSDITSRPLGECINEIKSMVEPFGYYVHQAKTQHDESGQRRVAALLADHPPKVK